MLKKHLRAFLLERGLSVAELARRTGVPKQTISDWLTGTRPRDMECVRLVASELDVSITQLFFGATVKESPIQPSRESQEQLVVLSLTQYYCDFIFPDAFSLFRVLNLRTGHPSVLSSSWEKTLGWSHSELMTKPWLDIVHLEDRNRLASAVKRDTSSRVWISACIHRLLHANGGSVRVHTKLAIDSAEEIMTSVSLPYPAE
jgi:transcriptional regulator with XRE-family HTH domain